MPAFYGPKKAPTARPGVSSRFYAELFPSERGSSSKHFTAVSLKEMGLKFSFDHKCRETSWSKANGFFGGDGVGVEQRPRMEGSCDCGVLAPGS